MKNSNFLHPYFFLLDSDIRYLILNTLSDGEKRRLFDLGTDTYQISADQSEESSVHLALIKLANTISKSESSVYRFINAMNLEKETLVLSHDTAPPLTEKSQAIKYKDKIIDKERPINVAQKSFSSPIKYKSHVKSSKKSVKYNEEQEAVIDGCIDGIKVNAFAGAGKSTVAEGMVQTLGHDKTIYTAFLRENALDGQAFAQSFNHDQLACKYALKSSPFESVFCASKFPDSDILYNSIGFDPNLDTGVRKIQRRAIGRTVYDTLTNYCHSTESEILLSHVPLSIVDANSAKKIVRWAKSLWDLMLSGRAEEKHSVYFQHLMKYWSLHPELQLRDSIKNIIIDEAQDLNGAFYNVLMNHSDRNINVIGDTYQQLFSWRGAVNSMSLFDKKMLPLTKSYRFGQGIAEGANNLLSHHSDVPDFTILGISNNDSKIIYYDPEEGVPDVPGAMLTRTRTKIVKLADDELERGSKIHVKTELGQMKKVVQNILYLANGEAYRINHDYISRCYSISNLEAELDAFPDPEVYYALKLYKEYGNRIIKVIERIENNSVEEDQAIKIISTTHSIKGKEWDNVVISEDYLYVLEKKKNG